MVQLNANSFKIEQISGVLLVILFIFNSTLINLFVKLTSASTTTIMFARYNVAFLFLMPFVPYLFKLRCSIWLHIIRACVVFMVNFLTYYGQKNAAFVNVNLISMSEPFFVFLYSALLTRKYLSRLVSKIINNLHFRGRLSQHQYKHINGTIGEIKPLSWQKIYGLSVGYLGVLTVVLFNPTNGNSTNTLLGNLAMVLANILNASLLFQSRYMAVMENIKTLLIYNTFCLWILSWFIKPSNNTLLHLSAHDIIFLFIIGLLAISVHFLNMQGLKRLNPENYSPLLYARIIFASIFAYLFLNETIGLRHFIGASLIIYGFYVINKKNC